MAFGGHHLRRRVAGQGGTGRHEPAVVTAQGERPIGVDGEHMLGSEEGVGELEHLVNLGAVGERVAHGLDHVPLVERRPLGGEAFGPSQPAVESVGLLRAESRNDRCAALAGDLGERAAVHAEFCRRLPPLLQQLVTVEVLVLRFASGVRRLLRGLGSFAAGLLQLAFDLASARREGAQQLR